MHFILSTSPFYIIWAPSRRLNLFMSSWHLWDNPNTLPIPTTSVPVPMVTGHVQSPDTEHDAGCSTGVQECTVKSLPASLLSPGPETVVLLWYWLLITISCNFACCLPGPHTSSCLYSYCTCSRSLPVSRDPQLPCGVWIKKPLKQLAKLWEKQWEAYEGAGSRDRDITRE